MEPISLDAIEQAEQRLSRLEDRMVEKLMARFTDEQPYLLVYLLTCAKSLPQDEQETLMYFGFKIWFTFLRAHIQVPTVPDTHIEKTDALNTKMLDYFSKESEDGFMSSLAAMLDTYPQRHLLEYMIVDIMESKENGNGTISDENKGVFFTTLKVVIECLSAMAFKE